MTWLGEWLREIILVVLLASFVEMLLPSKSMERYARLVLSLLVLLTILSPIVSFLKGDASKELSLAMEQQNLGSGVLSSVGQGAGTLEKILADGQKLAKGQQDQSLKLAALEIAGQMKEQITEGTGERGVQVTVALTMQKSDNPDVNARPAISSVTVQLSDTQTSTKRNDTAVTAEPIVIPPIHPIKVNIKPNEADDSEGIASTEASTTQPVSTDAAVSPDDTEGRTREADQAKVILNLLEQKWGLESGIIQVQRGSAEAAKL